MYGRESREHGLTRANGVCFAESWKQDEEEPYSPPGSDASRSHRLGLLSRVDEKALISSLATRKAIEGIVVLFPRITAKRKGNTQKNIPYVLTTCLAVRDDID